MCDMFVIMRNEYYLIFVIQEKGGWNSLGRFLLQMIIKNNFGASLNEDTFDPVDLEIFLDSAFLPDSTVPKILLYFLLFQITEGALSCISSSWNVFHTLFFFSANFLLICHAQELSALSVTCSASPADTGDPISLHHNL